MKELIKKLIKNYDKNTQKPYDKINKHKYKTNKRMFKI